MKDISTRDIARAYYKLVLGLNAVFCLKVRDIESLISYMFSHCSHS